MISPIRSTASLADRREAGALLQWLPQATAWATGIELVILRLFTRTAVHIPGLTALRFIYVPISEVGRAAFYVAVVLLILTLVSFVEDLYRRRSAAALSGAAGIALFLVAAAIARTGKVDVNIMDEAALAALLLLAPWALEDLRGRPRAATGLLVSAFVFSGLTGALQARAGSGLLLSDGSWLALAGEILAVGAALATPLIVGRAPGRSALIWGAAVGGSVYAGLLANGWTVRILLLWNFGLGGYLPSILYGIAAGAVTYAVVALRAAGKRSSALGIALLFMGGIGLHNTYQTGLVLAGLALIGSEGRSRRGTQADRDVPDIASDPRGRAER